MNNLNPRAHHFSHLHQTPRSSSKTMEDSVWEGINFTSLTSNPTSHTITAAATTTTTFKGAKFQDFLARPLTSFTAAGADPSPVTALTLSTRSEFHFNPLTHKDLQLVQPQHNPASKVEPFKRALRSGATSGDTPNTRLMKNRESAARSRARKQAYVFELKQKIKHLQEENATLRRQHQLLCESAANRRKRGNLYRTYTAPF